MQTGIIDLNSASLPSGSYLIDTNVLLYMYEIIQSKNDPGYNNLLMERINDSEWTFYVNSHIISEFINRFVRNSYNTYLKENAIIPPDRSYFKKVYRKTENFNTSYKLALDIVDQEILMQFNLTNELSEQSIKASIVTDCGDFNDQLIFNSAIQNKLDIITNDKDYFTVKMLHPDYPNIFSLQSFFKK